MYPSRSILKTVHNDYIDTYRGNIQIEIVEIDCDIDQLDGLANKNERFCVLVEGRFIVLHNDVSWAISQIGWQAIGFKTKAECKDQINNIKKDVIYHINSKEKKDQRQIEGKYIFKNKKADSIEKGFRIKWGIKL